MDSKRSNAINIGLTVLPPPRTIKTAILNFDEYALNKEGIEVRKNCQCLQIWIFCFLFFFFFPPMLHMVQARLFMEEGKGDVLHHD